MNEIIFILLILVYLVWMVVYDKFSIQNYFNYYLIEHSSYLHEKRREFIRNKWHFYKGGLIGFTMVIVGGLVSLEFGCLHNGFHFANVVQFTLQIILFFPILWMVFEGWLNVSRSKKIWYRDKTEANMISKLFSSDIMYWVLKLIFAINLFVLYFSLYCL